MYQLLDSEAEAIRKEVEYVQEKFMGKEFTSHNLELLQKELIGRIEDLGFEAIVDVTPLFEFQPVMVSIGGRLEGHFDHEKKAHEVKTSRKKGGI
jgi:hypothetical protein